MRKFYFKSLLASNTEEMKCANCPMFIIKMDLYNFIQITVRGFVLFMRIQIHLCLVLNELRSVSF